MTLTRLFCAFITVSVVVCLARSAEPPPFQNGESIALDRVLPANERGILCLAVAGDGHIYGGTTGRAAHLFVHDPAKDETRSLARLEGGVGFAHGLLVLPDGSLIGGTQADPTGTAVHTDPKAVGRLYRFTLEGNSPARVEDLGVPVAGQGIYTLAYVAASNEVVGNTWPDGHFFTCDLKTRKCTDHGAIAGYHTFEQPRHAELINHGTERKLRYPRQVSRAIAVDPETGAYTAGADGFLYRYDPQTKKLAKLPEQLPAVVGRETWASLDAAVVFPRGKDEDRATIIGGTSDGYLVELRLMEKERLLRPRGKPLSGGTIQGLVAATIDAGGHDPQTLYGIGGGYDSVPRSFRFSRGNKTMALVPGGLPVVDGATSLVAIGAVVNDSRGNIYAGERDRIARLLRFPVKSAVIVKRRPQPRPAPEVLAGEPEKSPPAKLPCHVVFAPLATTTDASGYTAIEVGKDGKVYVGSARYGDYAWLLRFDPAAKPVFMDKVVSMRELTGERRDGVNTNGKIHAKIVVGTDGRIWFASKQAHEDGRRPEYGEHPDGYPGGHLCWYDPKTGFSRSQGILMKQEGLQGGILDAARGRLYYRSEPRNHFLVYDIQTSNVQERGHVGAAGRYMAIDKKGAVYTVGRGATLCRYDPETGYVEDLAIKVEGEGGYTPPYVIALAPNGKLYGAAARHPWIMEFDVANCKAGSFPEVTMKNVAPAAPAGLTVADIHAGVMGKDGRFYYPLNAAQPVTKGRPQPHLRIMRFDPATTKTETVGIPEVVGLDEEKVKHTYNRGSKYELDHMQGAAVGADGSLYLLDIYPQLNVACFPGLTASR